MLNFAIKYLINILTVLIIAWVFWLVGFEFQVAVLVATMLLACVPVAAPIYIYNLQTLDNKPQDKPPGFMN